MLMILPPLYPPLWINLVPYQMTNPKVEKQTKERDPAPKPRAAPSQTVALYALFIWLLYRETASFSPLNETTYFADMGHVLA